MVRMCGTTGEHSRGYPHEPRETGEKGETLEIRTCPRACHARHARRALEKLADFFTILLVSFPGSADHECQVPFYGRIAGPHRGTYRRI